MKKCRKYERGKCITVYINKDTPDELVDWFNTRADVGPAILEDLVKLHNGTFIEIKEIPKYVNVLQILSEDIIKQVIEIKGLPNSGANSDYDRNRPTVVRTDNGSDIPIRKKDDLIKQPIVEKTKQPVIEEVEQSVVEEVKQPVVEEVESSVSDTLIVDEFMFEDINEKDNSNRTNEIKGKAKLQFSFDI